MTTEDTKLPRRRVNRYTSKKPNAKKSRELNLNADGISIPTKTYNAQVHDEEIENLLRDGFFAEDFCKKYRITKLTFQNWVEAHPTFKEAVKRGLAAGESVWVGLGREHLKEQFNYKYWSSIMHNRYAYGAKKISGSVKGMNPSQIIHFANEKYVEGEITDRQHARFLMAAEKLMKAEEVPILKAEIEQLKLALVNHHAQQSF